MINAKGSYLFLVRKYIEDRHGKEGVQKIVDTLNEESQKIYLGPIISSQWYPLSIYQDFLEGIENVYGIEELDAASAHLASTMLSGFFGFIAKFVSIDKVLRSAGLMWNKAFSEGKLTLAEIDDKRIILSLSEFEFNEAKLYSNKVSHCVKSTEVYMRTIIEIVTKKKVASLAKRIDKATTEFRFSFE